MIAAVVALPLLSLAGLPAPSSAAASGSESAGAYQPPPALPVNACNDTSLPRSYGTNFPVPNDPYGFGFANQSVIGWEGNWYAPFAYLSGSYFARGVPAHYKPRGTTYCGAMYSFGIVAFGLAAGQAPPAGSVSWAMADGYLPALTTSFTRNNVAISITDFADKVTIGDSPVEVVYTRVTARNNGTSTVTVDPGAAGPGLLTLASQPDTLAPGASATDDYAAAVDTFGSGNALPALAAGTMPTYDAAYRHMRGYWNSRLSVIPRLTLPNVPLPDTSNLANPGDALDNAYKAAFVYTRIVQSGDAPFSGANNYDWLLNHDLPGILANRFALGDFTDARNLLLDGRVSENPNFDEKGANWYWDGGAGVVLQASYDAPGSASGTASAEQWVRVQPPLPLPPGGTDLALTAAPSASYTSPWTTVTAISNGIYPIQSSDDNNLTPYWGDWPVQGTQWVELDWSSPVTTNGSDVYFADDGGGLRLPASWTVQYWNGSAFVDVPSPGTYPEADNTFNHVSFGSITTTKLRLVMPSGLGSVGVIQWVVPSIPATP
jgi:hypothetical protein